MSHVHYKFKSSIDHDTVTFDGLSLSLGELKKLIMTKSKLPKSADFDLQVTNAQTNEVYKSDADMIARNTSVIVTRVPVGGSSGAGDEGVTAGAGAKGRETAKAAVERLSKVTDLSKAQGSEEEKIMAMMNQASKDYSEANYIVKTRAPSGQPPASYICYRCGIKGHWIHNCPMQFQQKPDAMAFPGMMRGVKKTHGIPQSFLLPATKDTPGAMLTAIGTYAVPKMDAEAYARGKKEKPAFTENNDPAPINLEKIIPKELLCTLCNELLRDATVVPCCGVSFCDECVRKSLVEGDDEQECPACKRNIVPDQLIPNVFLRSTVTKFLSDSNLQPRRQAIVQPATSSGSPSSQSQPAVSGSPAHVAIVKAEPTSSSKTDEVRPATPVVDEKPEAVTSDPTTSAAPIAPSSSGTSTESSGSSADAQGQTVVVLGRKYANHNVEGPSQRPVGVRGHPATRGSSRHLGPTPGVVPVPHPTVLAAAPVMHGPIPYGMPRFRTMAPAIPTVAPVAVGFGPRGAPFSMYPSAAMPPVMYMPTAPQHMPGGPVLTAEEFYKEKARLLEEELQKQKKSDPLDDFARELLDYKKDQRKRQRSRTSSRSRSRSRKKSGSRSPRRRYRSRSHSRSRSPYYRRAPRSSRSPYRRRSPSAVTTSPPSEFGRSRRSSSPYSRFQHSPSSRDRYSDEYYRSWFDDYFRRVDPHYNPRYFEEYYRNFYERYARGSPLADPFGVSSRGAPFLGGYPLPLPHHDNSRGSYDYRHDFDVRQRNDDVSNRHRRRTSPSRTRNEDRSRRHTSESRRRSRGPSSEQQLSRDREDRIKKEGDKDKRTTHKDKKTKREKHDSDITPATQEKSTENAPSAKDANRDASTLLSADDRRLKHKKADSKRKRAASDDRAQSPEDDVQKRKRHSIQEGQDKSEETSASAQKVLQHDASEAVAILSAASSGSSAEASSAVQSEQAAVISDTVLAMPAELVGTGTVVAPESTAVHSEKDGSHETAAKKSSTLLVNIEDTSGSTVPANVQCSNSSTSGAAAHADSSPKRDSKRKRPRSPSELSSSRAKSKKKSQKPVTDTANSSEDAQSCAVVTSLKADGAKDGSSTAPAPSSSASQVPIKPPELSRWERDGDSSSEHEQSPKSKKAPEKSRLQSLPKSVIESAEKALMSKQPKPLVSSALGVMSVSSGSLSGRSVAGPSVISVGSSSRKVFIGANKESAATADVAHEGGIATDRKVQNVVSSVKITVSQDKGSTEEDACKDSRESCDRDKAAVPDVREGRKTSSSKVHKSDRASHSRHHGDQHKRRDSKADPRGGHDLDPRKEAIEKGRSQKSEVKKSSRSVAVVISNETRSSSTRHDYGDGRSRSCTAGTDSPKTVVSGKECDANESKRERSDSASCRVSTPSYTRQENHIIESGRQVASDGRVKESVDQRHRKSSDQKLDSKDATLESTTRLPKEATSTAVDSAVSAVPLPAKVDKLFTVSVMRSQSEASGVVEKPDLVASEPSSIRLSDEASFNPDYDETTTQSTGGSESAASDDDGPAVRLSLSKDKDARADVSDDNSSAKRRSDRAKSSHSRHKKHKKHTKKHKKHKKHKKSSSTKV